MRKSVRILIIIIAAVTILVFGMSAYVTMTTSANIAGTDKGNGIDQETVDECKSIDPQCILVLGCAVWADNQPSPMLKDRLDTAIELYRKGVAPKLLLSGDNSVKEYSEPDCMLEYTLKQGVPSEDIFLDFAGFSTYDSVYRANAIFKADRMIVVTQRYHLFRALRTCDALGITAKGVASDQRKYRKRFFREAREVLARDKDLIKGMLKPEPTYLGEAIPIDGDGRVTHVNSAYTLESSHEVDGRQGIAVDPDHNSMWMCSWVEDESSSYLYRYDLESGEYLGKVRMNEPPQWIQGIAYYDGWMYITADDGSADDDEPDHVYKCFVDTSLDEFSVLPEKTLDDVTRQGEIEGISFNRDSRQMLISYNRGAIIVKGMPTGFYDGYDKEIHEVFVYSIQR